MIRQKSSLKIQDFYSLWDEKTSPARFAGTDDMMDNIYVASRKGNHVRLVRKARAAIDPFATVFRGKILEDEDGCILSGFFSKSLFDYIILFLLLLADIAVFVSEFTKGNITNTLVIGCAVFFALLVILAIPLPSSRKRYAEFLADITGDFSSIDK